MQSLTQRSLEADQLRRHVQSFVRRFGLLAEDRTPCGAPLSPRDAHALMIVLERERAANPPCQNDLAIELGIDKSNVTRLVQKLVAAGRIEQVQSEADARARMLRLTTKGRRLAESVEAASHDRFREILTRIPAAQRKVVVGAMALLNNALVEHAIAEVRHAL
ncbi:MAG: MarR family winged helix-turn-helix transcriptional regulator [Myxococcota bacterium]